MTASSRCRSRAQRLASEFTSALKTAFPRTMAAPSRHRSGSALAPVYRSALRKFPHSSKDDFYLVKLLRLPALLGVVKEIPKLGDA
jgi:hypothetical protein